jgi:membrane protein DedA with SNARE-associated domain
MILSLLLTQWIGQDVVAAWVGDNTRSIPVFILLKAATVVFAPLSGGALYVIAPVMWSGWLAIVYVTIGNAIGISIAYWLGYRYADRAIGWFVGKKSLEQAHSIVDRVRGYWQFLTVRIVLFPLEDLINFVAGMARVPFWWFFFVSMVITTLLFGLFVGGFEWVSRLL